MTSWILKVQRCPTHLEGPEYRGVRSFEGETRAEAIGEFTTWWLLQNDDRLDDLAVELQELTYAE